MDSIRDRLHSIEDDFLAALVQGDDGMTAFNQRWELLVQDIDSRFDSTGMDSEISGLAHKTAIRLSTLAETSVSLLESCDTFTTQLFNEVDSLMAQLSLEDSPPRSPSSSPPSSTVVDLRPPKRRYIPDDGISPASRSKRRRSSSGDTSEAAERTRVDTVSATRSSGCSPSPISALPVSRKRRLSETDTRDSSQRKRLHVGPRLHAVSDSFVGRNIATSGTSCPPEFLPSTSLLSYPPTSSTDIIVPLDIQPLEPLFDSVSLSPFLASGTELYSIAQSQTSLEGDAIDSLVTSMLNAQSDSILRGFETPEAAVSSSPSAVPLSPSSSGSSTPSFPPTPPHAYLELDPPFYSLDPTVLHPFGADITCPEFAEFADIPHDVVQPKSRDNDAVSFAPLDYQVDWSMFGNLEPLAWLCHPFPISSTLHVDQ